MKNPRCFKKQMTYLFTPLFFVILLGSLSASGDIVERIVAIVNGQIISKIDIKNYREQLKKGSIVDDLLVKSSEVPSLLKNDEKLVKLMIDEKILDSEVKKQNLQVTIERVEAEVATISKRNGISPSQLKKALAAEGVSYSDYQNFIKKRIERQSLVQKSITSKIKISDDEIFSYYATETGNKKSLVFETKVAQIVFKSVKGGMNAARKRAEATLKKIKSSKKDFSVWASELSEDDDFSNGGILGTFRPGELKGPLDEAIQNLNEGEVSAVVETGSTLRILKAVEKKLIPDPNLMKQKGRIQAILSQKAFEKQFRFWLDKKRQQAFIRINKI